MAHQRSIASSTGLEMKILKKELVAMFNRTSAWQMLENLERRFKVNTDFIYKILEENDYCFYLEDFLILDHAKIISTLEDEQLLIYNQFIEFLTEFLKALLEAHGYKM